MSSQIVWYLMDSYDRIAVFFYLFALVFFFNTFIYLFNDYKDAPFDYHDLKKRQRNVFLDGKYKRLGIGIVIASLVLLLVAGFFGGTVVFVMSIVLALFAYNYSAGVRAKNKPGLDLLFHGLWVPLMLLVGILIDHPVLDTRDFVLLGATFILSTCGELYQEITDYEVDSKTGERTTVVIIGVERAKLATKVLFFIVTVIYIIVMEQLWLKIISGLFYFYVLRTDYTTYGAPRWQSAFYFIVLGFYYVLEPGMNLVDQFVLLIETMISYF